MIRAISVRVRSRDKDSAVRNERSKQKKVVVT